MPYPGHTTEEIARRGQEMYEREIRHEVEPEHRGRFLVLDVESSDYEIADDDLDASERLLERRPDAIRLRPPHRRGCGLSHRRASQTRSGSPR